MGLMMSENDLNDLCDHINQEWNEEIDRVADAICNRFDMMERQADYGSS
jgi:hypothetical protein